MASVSTFSFVSKATLPVATVGGAYLGYRALYVDWPAVITDFFTAPGKYSRIALSLFLVMNVKSIPFVWTARVFFAYFYHTLRGRPQLPPSALFHYSITTSRTSFPELDYNLHKSNSTYFADLDVTRGHLVMHLLGPGIDRIGRNAETKIIPDPKRDGKPMKGGFGIMLGAVGASFKREASLHAGYEMWSRVLGWDRKWLYIVTHFVVKGKVRPTGWDAGAPDKKARTRRATTTTTSAAEPADFSKYVIATAVSKYVFKLGRFTVHPSIVLEESGLLPARPGEGWRGGGEAAVGTPDEISAADLEGAEWDWKATEFHRRKGMELADGFALLDGGHALFDGAEDGSLGSWRFG